MSTKPMAYPDNFEVWIKLNHEKYIKMQGNPLIQGKDVIEKIKEHINYNFYIHLDPEDRLFPDSLFKQKEYCDNQKAFDKTKFYTSENPIHVRRLFRATPFFDDETVDSYLSANLTAVAKKELQSVKPNLLKNKIVFAQKWKHLFKDKCDLIKDAKQINDVIAGKLENDIKIFKQIEYLEFDCFEEMKLSVQMNRNSRFAKELQDIKKLNKLYRSHLCTNWADKLRVFFKNNYQSEYKLEYFLQIEDESINNPETLYLLADYMRTQLVYRSEINVDDGYLGYVFGLLYTEQTAKLYTMKRLAGNFCLLIELKCFRVEVLLDCLEFPLYMLSLETVFEECQQLLKDSWKNPFG